MAANDDIIMVVFRGTKEFADWAANLKASKRDCPSGWGGPESGKVHKVRGCCCEAETPSFSCS